MITPRGMNIRNIAYILLNWHDICVSYMNELAEIPPFARKRKKEV